MHKNYNMRICWHSKEWPRRRVAITNQKKEKRWDHGNRGERQVTDSLAGLCREAIERAESRVFLLVELSWLVSLCRAG